MRTLESRPGGEGVALSTLLEEVQQLRYEVRASKGSNEDDRFDRGRLLLSPDEYMYASLTNFLTSNPSFDGKRFLVDTRDGEASVSLLPEGLSGKARTLRYKFKHEPDVPLVQEVVRVKAELLHDLERIVGEADSGQA